MLDGDPEAGKTCLAMDVIARVTQGKLMPGETQPGDQKREPQNVSIIAKEDRYENTIKPRLEAAGADLARVACIDHIEVHTAQGNERVFITLPSHTSIVAEHLMSTRSKLLLIDPFDNHLDDGVNMASSQDMRRAYLPLIERAGEIGCGLLVIRHFGKKEYGNAKHKGLGSIGISALSRCNLGCVDDGEGGFVFGRIKGNLSRRPADLVYQIESWDADKEVPVLRWTGESDISVVDAATKDQRQSRETKKDQMARILSAMLRDGPRSANECLEMLQASAISERTFKRYKKELGIKSVKSGFQGESMLDWERNLKD